MQIPVEALSTGYELPSLDKHVTMEKMVMFSGCIGRSTHTDEAYAQNLGLPTAMAQGLMSHMYLNEVLVRTFGPYWLEGGKISVNFINRVFQGDTITSRAKVRSVEKKNGNLRVELEVWCTNQRGEMTTVGSAILSIPFSAGV